MTFGAVFSNLDIDDDELRKDERSTEEQVDRESIRWRFGREDKRQS